MTLYSHSYINTLGLEVLGSFSNCPISLPHEDLHDTDLRYTGVFKVNTVLSPA
jgi:hypothetical protein